MEASIVVMASYGRSMAAYGLGDLDQEVSQNAPACDIQVPAVNRR